MKKGTQDTHQLAGIKNPNGEKAIERRGHNNRPSKKSAWGRRKYAPQAINVSPFSTSLLVPA